MNRLRTLFALLIALLPVACSDRPQPRPILSDEYDIYAQFIVHIVSSKSNSLSARREVFVVDSTKDSTIDLLSRSYRRTISEQRGTILYLLQWCADTFQVAALDEDYSRHNRRQFFINIDSFRIRLASASTTIAESHTMLSNNSYAFQFSRIAFNPTFDQAMVKVKYWNFFGGTGSDAYFVRKKGKWQYVHEVYQATARF
jgi:hypothetical protein